MPLLPDRAGGQERRAIGLRLDRDPESYRAEHPLLQGFRGWADTEVASLPATIRGRAGPEAASAGPCKSARFLVQGQPASPMR